jgi:hypothetical protein
MEDCSEYSSFRNAQELTLRARRFKKLDEVWKQEFRNVCLATNLRFNQRLDA